MNLRDLHVHLGKLTVPPKTRRFWRGEPGPFEATFTYAERVRRGIGNAAHLNLFDSDEQRPLPTSNRPLLFQLIHEFAVSLACWTRSSTLQALGYCQHYGLPTDLLDLSTSLDTAIAFASTCKADTTVRVASVDVKEWDDWRIADLTQHDYGDRPRRQSAFAVPLAAGQNLKDGSNRPDWMSVTWHECTASAGCVALYAPKQAELLDLRNDSVASLLHMVIDDHVERNGKMNDWIAKYISDRVPPILTFTQVVQSMPSNGVTLRTVPPPADFCFETQRFNCHRKWSNQFPRDRPNTIGALDPFNPASPVGG